MSGVDWIGDESPYLCQRVPSISRNSRIYNHLIGAISAIEKLLEPAQDTQIIALLLMLRLHFPTSYLSEQEASILMKDYLDDLSGFPPDIIEQVCLEYRRNSKSLYFPKVGQLLELIKKRWYARNFKLQKLKRLLEASK